MDEATNPPPLKIEPRWGYYPRWPEDGDDWLHPEDVELARKLLPSNKVWRRESRHGEFHIISYGPDVLRVRPALWHEIAQPDYEIGDWVEVRTRMMKNEAHTGRVIDVEWDDYRGEVVYHIQENEKRIVNAYAARDLTPVAPAIGQEHSCLPADTPEATEGVDDLIEGLPKDEGFGPPKKR